MKHGFPPPKTTLKQIGDVASALGFDSFRDEGEWMTLTRPWMDGEVYYGFDGSKLVTDVLGVRVDEEGDGTHLALIVKPREGESREDTLGRLLAAAAILRSDEMANDWTTYTKVAS